MPCDNSPSWTLPLGRLKFYGRRLKPFKRYLNYVKNIATKPIYWTGGLDTSLSLRLIYEIIGSGVVNLFFWLTLKYSAQVQNPLIIANRTGAILIKFLICRVFFFYFTFEFKGTVSQD